MFEEINKLHPTIKFTISHTSLENNPEEHKCEWEPTTAIPLLDTLCFMKERHKDTDLHKKETNWNLYLLPRPCHQAHTKKAIPYSLSMIIVRICSDRNNRPIRLKDL